jgi:outer membrane protein assembly factor BamA
MLWINCNTYAGANVNFIQQNYGKPDFSSMHDFSIRASTLGNLQLGYEGTVRHVLGQWDLTLAARGSDARRFNYFFGLGNETKFDQDSLRNGYYTLRYSNVTGIVGLKRSFWKRSNFEISAELSSFGAESGENNILNDDLPDELGGASMRIARLNWLLEFDLRDRPHLPTSGVHIIAEGFFANRLNQDGAYSMTKGSMEWHGTARPFTLGLRAGGWFHHQLPPFYDLGYLGHNTYLRGFRRNRFAGDRGGAYFNSDVRIKVFDNPNALIPYKIGLLLFYDVGRVFQSEEDSNVWHTGYGFGVYAVPFRERFVIGISVGFSVEESAFLQFGFGKLF